MFDAAHIAGLIAGGVHPNLMPYVDVMTFHHAQDPPWSAVVAS